MSKNNKTLFKNICEKGKFYNPATKHYGGEGEVTCDRCQKSDIPMCIGWKENDLCLDCVSEIGKSETRKGVTKVTKPDKGSVVKPRRVSRSSVRKRMRQNMFRRNSRKNSRKNTK